MISRLLKQNLINKNYIILLILSVVFISLTFFLLIGQRNNITKTSYYEDFFIVTSIIFILFLLYLFITQLFPFIIRVRKKNITTFNNRFSLYFIGIAITPAIIVGSIALLLINFGVNDWFNNKIQDVIKNSVYVAEGYLEEHKKTIKGDIYAMSSDLNRSSEIYIRDKLKFENIFFTQSLVRNLPESFLIDGKGNVILKNRGSLKIYYQPPSEALLKVSKGELALFTSTQVNKVYALIKLEKFLDLYLYVGRPMDNRVLSALNNTKSAQNDFNLLKENRSKLSIIFILIYLIITMILIFISIIVGINFARKIVDPITNIIIATDNISKGNYELKLKKSNDFIELNLLTDSFNKMSNDLLDQKNKLIISQKHEAWSDVARMIAHEIKNPLTPIKLSIDRLKNKLSKGDIVNNDEFNDIIFTINRQVDDISRLVDEFSSFARMPSPNMETNNIEEIIDESISLFNKDALSIKFEKIYDTQHLIVSCDRSQINRVLNNIFINSIHAINSHEENKYNGLITIKLHRNENKLIVNILDNGTGIKHDEKFLLQPYFTTKDKNLGSGLGLSIVEKIISEHGGSFKIFNRNDINGTCCEFSINLVL